MTICGGLSKGGKGPFLRNSLALTLWFVVISLMTIFYLVRGERQFEEGVLFKSGQLSKVASNQREKEKKKPVNQEN